MRYSLSIIVSFLLCCSIQSQDFAPIGAEWYYHEGQAFSGDINYIKFTSVKDTLIQGEVCRKITKRRKLWCNDRPMIEYLFTRNDTVFFLDTTFNGFQILYDFSSQKSDTWIIKTKDENLDIDTIIVTVDSISYTPINGYSLKTLHVTYKKLDEGLPFEIQSKILERIGDPQYMFNWTHYSLVVCDINWTQGLRCYYDEEFGLYSTGIADSCTYTFKWTGMKNNALKPTIVLSPNPTTGKVEIKTNNNIEIDIELRNLMGRSLFVSKSSNNEVFDLTNFPDGIYILIAKDGNKILDVKKIIKY